MKNSLDVVLLASLVPKDISLSFFWVLSYCEHDEASSFVDKAASRISCQKRNCANCNILCDELHMSMRRFEDLEVDGSSAIAGNLAIT